MELIVSNIKQGLKYFKKHHYAYSRLQECLNYIILLIGGFCLFGYVGSLELFDLTVSGFLLLTLKTISTLFVVWLILTVINRRLANFAKTWDI